MEEVKFHLLLAGVVNFTGQACLAALAMRYHLPSMFDSRKSAVAGKS